MEYDFYEPLPATSSKMKYKNRTNRYRATMSDHNSPKDGDFKCIHCKAYVVHQPYLSGVQNRNHCPYCLWSKHVDLHHAGDRLAACKSQMQPVGLALKKSRKKYGADAQGELMLIHQCAGCGKVSANRIAADDLTDRVYAVFERSLDLDEAARAELESSGVQPLSVLELPVVHARLDGNAVYQ